MGLSRDSGVAFGAGGCGRWGCPPSLGREKVPLAALRWVCGRLLCGRPPPPVRAPPRRSGGGPSTAPCPHPLGRKGGRDAVWRWVVCTRTLLWLLAKPGAHCTQRGRRLFNKNTGLCEVERRRIGPDTCPVPEG